MFSEPESDFSSFFVPDEVGLAVDDFILIFSMSDFFDHEELSGVMGVGGYSYDSGVFVLVGVVGLYSEGLVAVLADDLVDVSSGEKEGLHISF